MRKIFAEKIVILLLGICGLFGFSGCYSLPHTGRYQDEKVYPTAMLRDVPLSAQKQSNPVVVVHGIYGARLVDRETRENIWGDFSISRMLSNDLRKKLAHPVGKGIPLSRLTGPAEADSLLEHSRILLPFGGTIELNNYNLLTDALRAAGYSDTGPHTNLFVFFYDWRRDISENSAKLSEFLIQKQAELESRSAEKKPVKFDLVGHSMGGLVIRYYLMYGNRALSEKSNPPPPVTWAGAANVDKVVILGTPNAGYADTILELLSGFQPMGISPVYPKALIGTFVSLYEMLPFPETHSILDNQGKPVDFLNPQIWEKYQWGILAPDEDNFLKLLFPRETTRAGRFAAALDHLSKCLTRAKLFQQSMLPQNLPPQPRHLRFFLVSGNAVPTVRTVEIDQKTGRANARKSTPGDGKITVESTLLDCGGKQNGLIHSPIRWESVLFLPGGHMGIMNGDTFASNLQFLLNGLPPMPQQR